MFTLGVALSPFHSFLSSAREEHFDVFVVTTAHSFATPFHTNLYNVLYSTLIRSCGRQTERQSAGKEISASDHI